MPPPDAASAAALNLVAIAVSDLAASAAFFRALGLAFDPEVHPGVPHHLAARLGHVVFELHPEPLGSTDGRTRLGFTVDHLDDVLERLGAEARVHRGPSDTRWGRRMVLFDPDGRKVDVVERQ